MPTTARLAACVLLALATPLGAQPPTPAVAAGRAAIERPAFDVSSLEPAVAEQLSALAEHVDAVLATESSASEKAAAIGELGRHYHAYELVEPAEACFRAAADLAPQDFGWHYHLGYLLQQTGRLPEAVAAYQRALGIVPDVPPALIRLGEVYQALDQPEAAVQALERALRLDPVASAAHATMGEILLSQQRYREAANRFETALQISPEANLLYYPLALAYRGLGEDERARELLAQRGKVGVRPADPMIDGMATLTTGERVHLLRGRRAFGAGRFAEAATEFRRATEANRESVSAWVNLGTALGQGGEVEPAIESFRRAIELGPGNAAARFNLGQLLARQGRLEEAREELRGAVLYAPRDGPAHYELGEVLAQLGRPAEALVHYALAIESAPPAEEARLAQARALIALERWPEARERLEEAHAAIPASGRIAYALARFLAACPVAELRDGERALALAMRVHAAQATSSHAELVAEALAEVGRCAEAADWQRRALAGLDESAPEPVLRRIHTRLAHYRDSSPCRPPVAPLLPARP